MQFKELDLNNFFESQANHDTNPENSAVSTLKFKVVNEAGEKLQFTIKPKDKQLEAIAEYANGGEVTASFENIDTLKVIVGKKGKRLIASTEMGLVFFIVQPKFNWRMVNRAIERHLRPFYRTESGRKAIGEIGEVFGEIVEHLEILKDDFNE